MNDVERFLAHAIQLEREAARRYEELRAAMQTEGNAELKVFFARMAHYSRLHLADAQARGGFRELPVIAPEDFAWPEGISPETADWAGVDAQMDAMDALQLALASERRGHAYYAAVAAQHGRPGTARHRQRVRRRRGPARGRTRTTDGGPAADLTHVKPGAQAACAPRLPLQIGAVFARPVCQAREGRATARESMQGVSWRTGGCTGFMPKHGTDAPDCNATFQQPRRCVVLNRTPMNERSHVELITIYEICRILGASLDITRTFRAALNVLAAHMGLPRAMIVMAPSDPDEVQLKVHSHVGLDQTQAARGQWHYGEGVIGRVYATGMPAVVPDVSQASEFIDRTGAFSGQPDRMMAFVVVPLKTDKAVVGVLAAQREVQGGARLSDDQRILTMVASLLAQAVALHSAVRDEHQRLQQETTRLQKALAREPTWATRHRQRDRRLAPDAAGVQRGAPGRALTRHGAVAR